MTTPNLDALAKLGPFAAAGTWGGDEFFGCDGSELDRDDIAAALNDWAELRASAANRAREVSALRDELHAMGVRLGVEQSKGDDLRAYKQRTEELIHHVWAWFDDHDDRMASFELHRMLKGAVDPARPRRPAMASDLIQRAAAICGYPFTPNSDQLAAWLDRQQRYVVLHQGLAAWHASAFAGRPGEVNQALRVACGSGLDLLHCLAAAVVEVDRIEREAKQP